MLAAWLVQSALTLLLAGHGPFAGRTIWRLDTSHGLNAGDLPVLALWLVGSVCCLALGRRA